MTKPLSDFTLMTFDFVGTLIDFEDVHGERLRDSAKDWKAFQDSVADRAKTYRLVAMTNCWIERRHAKAGTGGTIAPAAFTRPDYHFTSMAALAEAAAEGRC